MVSGQFSLSSSLHFNKLNRKHWLTFNITHLYTCSEVTTWTSKIRTNGRIYAQTPNPKRDGYIELTTLRYSYYNHALGQVAYLFNKVILCVQRHATMFVQVYANPFIGERIMNI